ncbi:MAG: hypothetical protein CMH49_09100, partial [Myxococcales bacterium]|nr:hypothetical protein [Myxococcales bacterium]
MKCDSEHYRGSKKKTLTLLTGLRDFDPINVRQVLSLSFVSIFYVGFIFVSSCIYLPSSTLAKLYNCEKNGTIVISSEPCQKKYSRRSKSLSKPQTCFLQDRKTLEQSLVSNPSRKQLKRS